ncbi:hypothetical protein IWQ60_010569 [Tieghemiomyces parasiticus]|uniref:RING-type domain-containing protein n=1 Tax=Tieghemiomyces parasiticus TaxID=78921 RepID=A0A9W7ZKS6_9FUNG|nr:hypothetical protein IWQ60_010569 [Tieghemiomyces parasiticus]
MTVSATYLITLNVRRVDAGAGRLQFLPDNGNGMSHAESFTVPKEMGMDWVNTSALPLATEGLIIDGRWSLEDQGRLTRFLGDQYPFLVYGGDPGTDTIPGSKVAHPAGRLLTGTGGDRDRTRTDPIDVPAFPLEEGIDVWLDDALSAPEIGPRSLASPSSRVIGRQTPVTVRMVYARLNLRLSTRDGEGASTVGSTSTSGWAIIIAVVFSTIFVALAAVRFLILARRSRWARNHGLAGHDADMSSMAHFDLQQQEHWQAAGFQGHLLDREMLEKFPLVQLDPDNLDWVCRFRFCKDLDNPTVDGEGTSGNMAPGLGGPPLPPITTEKPSGEDTALNSSSSLATDNSDASLGTPQLPVVPNLPYHHTGAQSTTPPLPAGSTFTEKAAEKATAPPASESASARSPSLKGSTITPPCSICLEDFEADQSVRVLPCRHAFHMDCVDQWLTTKYSRCPLCKLDCYYYLKDRHPELFVHNRNHLLNAMNRQTWRFGLRPPGRMLIPGGENYGGTCPVGSTQAPPPPSVGAPGSSGSSRPPNALGIQMPARTYQPVVIPSRRASLAPRTSASSAYVEAPGLSTLPHSSA